MSTRVFLVRHGATTRSTENRFAGAIEVPLSEIPYTADPTTPRDRDA